MPGFGEFFIGNSAPMITRIGVPTDFKVDKTVEGSRDELAASTAAQPIADVSFATVLGLGQKCIGVQWAANARFAIVMDRGADGTSGVAHIDVKNSKGDLTATDDGTGGWDNHFGDGFADPACAAFGMVGADPDGTGGTPSFVIVGGAGLGTAGTGLIMHSADGISWTNVFTLPNDGGPFGAEAALGANMYIVTWDGTQFWAAGNKFANTGVLDPNAPYTIDNLFSSSDGISWSAAGINVVPFPEWSSYEESSGLIIPHLDDRVPGRLADGSAAGSPSGFFGEKKSKDQNGGTITTLIHPTGKCTIETLFGAYDPGSGGVTRTGGGQKSGAVTDPSFSVGAVSHSAGSCWMAIGTDSNSAAVTFDDGATWHNVTLPAGDRVTVGVMGAKGTDIPNFNPK